MIKHSEYLSTCKIGVDKVQMNVKKKENKSRLQKHGSAVSYREKEDENPARKFSDL